MGGAQHGTLHGCSPGKLVSVATRRHHAHWPLARLLRYIKLYFAFYRMQFSVGIVWVEKPVSVFNKM